MDVSVLYQVCLRKKWRAKGKCGWFILGAVGSCKIISVGDGGL